jgi:hypothetical protein
MSEWIELNLPYELKAPYFELPIKQPTYPIEAVIAKTIEKFGKSYEQALDEYNDKLANEISDYTETLDFVLAYYDAVDKWYNYVETALPLVSFYHSVYNEPGTVIEVLEHGELKKYLIGHGGSKVTSHESIVVRCKILDIDFG